MILINDNKFILPLIRELASLFFCAIFESCDLVFFRRDLKTKNALFSLKTLIFIKPENNMRFSDNFEFCK